MAKVPPMPLEEAQAHLLALASPLPVEHVDIEGAIGRYLAQPLLARRTQPAADLSAMDGYAVTAGDMAGPWHVVGESAAGHPFAGEVTSGQAVQVSTGALLPAGAAAVILQEDLARQDDRIMLTGDGPLPPHKHIRPCGLDFRKGSEVIAAGSLIGPADAALAIAAGHKHLPVCRKPRVAVIDSGDELASDPETCAPHQIPASNGAMLLAMARKLPVEAWRSGPVADTLDALIAAFDEAHHADVIVTSGGASAGEHDLIRPALEAWGASLDFWRVAIKPGKPILVARRKRRTGPQIVIGLPGNPVSSFVTAYHFMLPLLRRMLGARYVLPMQITTRLGAPIRANGGRREFVRGTWNGQSVVPQALQDSGALSALALSNVLIDRAAFAPAGAAGDEVRVFLLQNGGIA
ncbi:molybdopterin molybdotransferase MoeA [Novosphingobium beihaiensis]|uniref:Molybdopterin molybdenumtransferase n=1 Tax=Novosphingobium beihaiensis TaxID=2930389 RepID=A0ABT0BNB5_9SPHN|nr:molybdopterin molybdotransferase MoeA [Novosphingobium beihaiensis]MCJ2186209.1 molybdopterin molybdotransferase MoeA [Novosphingobium beihaiensis]